MMNNRELLEERWYNALNEDKIDYGIYNEIGYLEELDFCYKKYSSKYLKSIENKKKLLHRVMSILDLGCGVGITTKRLKEIFIDTIKVYGTNLEGTLQFEEAKKLGCKNGFEVVSSIEEIDNIDLVFASEYFEHILNPIEHLVNIIKKLSPRYFIIANAFNAKAIGHFNRYYYRDMEYEPLKISRLFNNTLRKYNYVQLKTGLWNNRPTFWELKKINTLF